MHKFLVNVDGLSEYGKHVIELKEYIDDMPETAATFRPHQVSDDVPTSIPTEIYEFAGSWPVNEYYDASRNRMFVNPNYVHVQQYCDLVVECECGARLTGSYDDTDRIQDEHSHSDDCVPHYRLQARAEILERRFETIKHCMWLGWRGKDIAKRLGMTENIVSSTARDYGTTLTELRDEYRKSAAETYVYLVRKHGIPAEVVTDIYGHRRSSLSRWAREFTNFESETVNQFTRGDDGTFTWDSSATVKE